MTINNFCDNHEENKKIMNVKEIINKYLIIAGYDGLYCPGLCSCKRDALMPCQDNPKNCFPGYFQVLNKEEKRKYDFIIGSDKLKKR